MDLLRLRQNVFGRPLAIHPEKLKIILGVVGHRLGLDVSAVDLEAVDAKFMAVKPEQAYSVTQQGVAIIPVTGSLMAKTSGMSALSGCSSYEQIGNAYKTAMNDSNIRGIVLDIDSPGGSTSGLFELCDMMAEFKGAKPVFAVSNDSCFSAAYAIASIADKIYLTRTGGVGSIGVFALHVDQSKADAQEGLKYEYIKAGDKKTDGNPHEPLTDSARADMQSEVNRQYDMFVALVASNRKLAQKSVKGTEAGCFFGENAIPTLADAVGTLEDALLAINSSVIASRRTPNMKKPVSITVPAADAGALAGAAAPPLKPEGKKKRADDEYMEKDEDDDEDEDEDDDDEEEEGDDKKKGGKKAAAATAPAVDGRAEATRIVTLCSLAGLPHMAAEFLSADYTVGEVEASLLKHRAAKSKENRIPSGHLGQGDPMAGVFDRIMNDKSITNKAEAYAKVLKSDADGYVAYLKGRGK